MELEKIDTSQRLRTKPILRLKFHSDGTREEALAPA